MSDKTYGGKDSRVRDIILRLNAIAQQRKDLLDKLWSLEHETDSLRLELLKLIKKD